MVRCWAFPGFRATESWEEMDGRLEWTTVLYFLSLLNKPEILLFCSLYWREERARQEIAVALLEVSWLPTFDQIEGVGL